MKSRRINIPWFFRIMRVMGNGMDRVPNDIGIK